MTRYSLLFHNQQIKDLKELAKTRSVSDIIRSLVDDYIEKKKKSNISESLSKRGGVSNVE